MANVFIEESTMAAIGAAIRNKTGKEEKILPANMPAEIESIEVGQSDTVIDEHYHAFWDVYQNSGKATNYYWGFAYSRWTDAIYHPKYTIIGSTTSSSLQNLFYSSSITHTKVPIDARNTSSITGMFYWARKLVTVEKLIIDSGVTTAKSLTADNQRLKNITIEGTIACDFPMGGAPLLSKASIQSILDALSTTVSGKTVTFHEAAINAAFETSTGANDGKESPEWAALVDAHQTKDESGNVIGGWNFGYTV